MISFDIGPTRFNYRVAGVAVHDGHVLLQTVAGLDFWFLPGGRCEANECSSAALAREMREECGETVTVGRLLWVAENFFTLDGRPGHELGFYYLMTLAPGSPFLDRQATPSGREEGGFTLIFTWFPIEALETLPQPLHPAFLRSGLVLLC